MYDISVLGNSPVDVLTHVDENMLTKYNLNKGDFNSVSDEIFSEIVDSCTFEGMESGGSCANTAWALGMMGKHTYFMGNIGNDPAGKHFYKDMQKANVEMPEPTQGDHTMEIAVLITPDGERSFISRGVKSPLTVDNIDEDIIKKSNWLLLEGYLLTNQLDSVIAAVKFARKHGTKIAFTVSAVFAIQITFQSIIDEILPYTDLLIANDTEFNTLMDMINDHTDTEQKERIATRLKNIAKIITHSEEGASFIKKNINEHMPTTPIKDILDATGAGDAFVAGFLYGYLEGDITKGLTLGHKLGGKIIQQLGGRMKDISFLRDSKNAA